MHRILPILAAVLFITAGCDRPEQIQNSSAAIAFDFTGDFSGPLGVQLYSVRRSLNDSLAETLAWVRDQGFQEVETHSTYGLTPQQFREELDRAGIRATAMHTGYERLRDSTEVVLDEAEALGVDYVGVAWIPHNEDEPFSVELARQTAADFNTWGEAAAERGLQFFYHTHGYEFEPAPDGTIPFDVIMEETNPENVTFEMDVFWVAHPGADPVQLLQQYSDRWKLMHIKDMRQGTASDYSGHAPTEANVPVGTGQIDYAEVLRVAREVGVERYYIEDETSDPVANIPQSVDYLEQVTYGGAEAGN